MRKFSKAYMCLALVALPVFVLIMWVSPVLGQQFFCRGEDSCFREYFSALSGWAAAGAAALTLRSLKQQIEEANRHQRENVELTVMGRMAVSGRLTIVLWKTEPLLNAIPDFPLSLHQPLPSQEVYLQAKEALAGLGALLRDPDVVEFDREIGLLVPSHPSLANIDAALAYATTVDEQIATGSFPPHAELLSFCLAARFAKRDCQIFSREGLEAARNFRRRWSPGNGPQGE